jgi:ribosomal protein S15P/S13E
MQCKDLEFVLESEGLGTLSAEAREHLAACSACQGLLADLHSIVAVARTFPAEVDPPARVWVSLRAQLEAEGLIKEPVASPVAAPWWESLRVFFQPRSLAAAAASILLVATTVFLTHKPSNGRQPIANIKPAMQSSQPEQSSAVAPAAPPTAPAAPAPTVAAKAHTPVPMPSRIRELAPSPSETASSTLSQAELSLPDMELAGNTRVDASLRENLHTLNEFIAECEQHLKQNPQDQLAREYLYTAYQQKADLLAAMMESGRSEH